MRKVGGRRTPFGGVFVFCLMMFSITATAQPDFSPAGASIAQLSKALDSGQLTSLRLVKYYLDRIERLDKRGPHINALISVNPLVLEQATTSDARRNSVQHRSRLYGIPFVAKDNFDTAGITTTGGSAVLAHSKPRSNAAVVQRLLGEGAILIGKANMSELAASYGRLGYSSAGGLTLNPYNLARNASGSSSGSAAAVAADFAAFAIGTDTSGSLRGPASVAGLVGLRPTFGLISRRGVIPSSLTFDAAGMLARTVEDAAIILDAIVGGDPHDAATLDQPGRVANYADGAGKGSLKGARLGLITNFREGNLEVDAVEERTLRVLKERGAVVIPLTLAPQFEGLWDSVLAPVGEAEFKAPFERYLHGLAPAQPRTLAQFIKASTSRPQQQSSTPANPLLIDALRRADTTPLTDSPGYIHILTVVIPALRDELKMLIAANRLDALVFSTMSCPASPRYDRADESYVCHSEDPYEASYVASVTGFPEITIPAGQISGGLPVGISFAGVPYSEDTLLGLADAVQLALPQLSPPRFGVK